jgi:YVTN family beta-propeller protein
MALKLRLIAAVSLAAVAAGVGPMAWARQAAPSVPQAFVANFGSNTVTPIDLATKIAGPPIGVGKEPIALAALPDGKTLYVVNEESGTVTPIDVATDQAGRAINVGKFPVAIAITPNGKTAYVARSAGGNLASGAVIPITTATGKVGKPIDIGPVPAAMTITPDGRTVLVTSHAFQTFKGKNSITSISTKTNKKGRTLALPGEAPTVAVAPDGRTAYVGSEGKRVPNQGGSNLGLLTPITIASMTEGEPIVLGHDPYQGAFAPDSVSFTPDGKWAYVLYPGVNGLDRVNLTLGKEVGKKILLSGFADAGVITPDGQHVYAEGQTFVNAVDPSAGTDTVVNLKVWSGVGPPNPVSQTIAMAPDGTAVYALSWGKTNGAVVPVEILANIREKPIAVGVKPVAIVLVP